MARLPQPGGDAGSWGSVLNDYLSQIHEDSGILKSNTVGSVQLQNSSVTSDKLAPGVVTSSILASGSVGVAQLADGVITATKLNTTTSPSANQVLTYNGSALTWTTPVAAPVSSVVGLTGAITGAQIAADSALVDAFGPDAEQMVSAFVPRVSQAIPTPLIGINKSAAAPYRILQLGTSIAANAYAPNQTLVAHLRASYGNTAMTRWQAGVLGGSYSAYAGWLKQPYSGVYFMRARGSSSSSPLTVFTGFGDQVVIEWSRESDTAAAEVFVDGVSVGTFGSAGTQTFGLRTMFTVSKGAHQVTINQPTSGFCYLEAVEIRDSARRGVETIDGTLGGSSLSRAVIPATATGDQAAPIATTYGAGLRALYDRDDVDLIIHSFTVNDAGNGSDTVQATNYRTWLDIAVAIAKGRNIPVVLIIEPAGHYSLINDGGSTAFHLRYEAVKNHQIEVAAANDHVFLADWDTSTRISDPVAYAAAYYPAVSGINTTTGTFLGDFIHPDGSLTNSAQDVGKQVLAKTMGFLEGISAAKTTRLIELEILNRPGVAMLPLVAGNDNSFARKYGAYIRDTAATNLRPALNNTISSAGTSDANGKYFLTSPNVAYTLGAESGLRMLTMRIGPNDSGIWSILFGNANLSMFDLDGNEIFPTSATKQVHVSGCPVGSVYVVAMQISQDVSNQFLTITGRIYEAALTNSKFPLLCAPPA